jgi:hypothetical protein
MIKKDKHSGIRKREKVICLQSQIKHTPAFIARHWLDKILKSLFDETVEAFSSDFGTQSFIVKVLILRLAE